MKALLVITIFLDYQVWSMSVTPFPTVDECQAAAQAFGGLGVHQSHVNRFAKNHVECRTYQ